MLQNHDSTVYFVPDINSAAKWYSDITGAEIKYENELYAYIEVGNAKIGFHPEDKKSRPGQHGQTSYWRVSSLKTAMELLTQKGATLYRGPIFTDLNEHVCVFLDPFENTLGLISDEP